jgi:hypothetical protein
MSRNPKRFWDLWWAWLPALLAIGIFVALFAAPAPAGADRSTASKRLLREIDIMERTLDDALVDSPYILVSSSSGVTKGVYVPEYGVIFTFDMNLVSSRYGNYYSFGWHGADIVDIDEDGDKIVIHRRHGWDDDDDDEDDAKDSKSNADQKSWREKREAEAKKCYERGKNEIVETLVDYGDMLTSLGDDQWLLVAANLEGSEYFTDEGLSQYIVKAQMRDIRAYSQGTITRDALLAKVTREES